MVIKREDSEPLAILRLLIYFTNQLVNGNGRPKHKRCF
jgi:hypothetical protein